MINMLFEKKYFLLNAIKYGIYKLSVLEPKF